MQTHRDYRAETRATARSSVDQKAQGGRPASDLRLAKGTRGDSAAEASRDCLDPRLTPTFTPFQQALMDIDQIRISRVTRNPQTPDGLLQMALA